MASAPRELAREYSVAWLIMVGESCAACSVKVRVRSVSTLLGCRIDLLLAGSSQRNVSVWVEEGSKALRECMYEVKPHRAPNSKFHVPRSTPDSPRVRPAHKRKRPPHPRQPTTTSAFSTTTTQTKTTLHLIPYYPSRLNEGRR